jgi:hypothetical protein
MLRSSKRAASWAALIITMAWFVRAGPLPAQPARGTLERTTVHGAPRAGNFGGAAPSVRLVADEQGAGTQWPVRGVEPPKTELVLEAYVKIAPAVAIGKSDAGTRRFIPITGGRFVGDGIKGEVMAGGADWQLVRQDGVLEVNALYSIRTDDGVTIEVDNRGIIVPGGPPAAGRPAAQAYVRTTPKFHAPQGKYDWLNKNVFVGGIAPAANGGAVVIRVFKVL